MAYAAYRYGTTLTAPPPRQSAPAQLMDVTLSSRDGWALRKALAGIGAVVVRCQPLLHRAPALGPQGTPRVQMTLMFHPGDYQAVTHCDMQVLPDGVIGRSCGWQAYFQRWQNTKTSVPVAAGRKDVAAAESKTGSTRQHGI